MSAASIERLHDQVMHAKNFSRVNDPVIQKFIRIYQNSETVKADIHRAFNSDKRLYTLAWQKP